MTALKESYNYWKRFVCSMFRAEPPLPIEERLRNRMQKEFSESDWSNPDKELEISVKEHYEYTELYRKHAREFKSNSDVTKKPTMFNGFKLKVNDS